MENMNFYQIQIGRITRAGNMDALHSFVCRTSNSNRSNVYNHFVNKYSGLTVHCDPIKEVVTEEIPKDVSDYMGHADISLEAKEIKSLKQELKLIKQESDTIKDSVYSNEFPEEARILIGEMNELSNLRKEKREEAESIIKKWLLELYHPFASNISSPEHIEDSAGWFRYTVKLKGKLTPNISTKGTNKH